MISCCWLQVKGKENFILKNCGNKTKFIYSQINRNIRTGKIFSCTYTDLVVNEAIYSM